MAIKIVYGRLRLVLETLMYVGQEFKKKCSTYRWANFTNVNLNPF